MGCYFCVPSEKTEIKTLEGEINTRAYELFNARGQTPRLYTVREEQNEASDCSEQKLHVDPNL